MVVGELCGQVAEISRLGSATKKVQRELKLAKGTGSIEEAKLVSHGVLWCEEGKGVMWTGSSWQCLVYR